MTLGIVGAAVLLGSSHGATSCARPYRPVSEVRAVAPKFPEKAKELGLGRPTIPVRVVVDAAGRVVTASVVKTSGFSYFDNAALVAAMKSSYAPEIKNCTAVRGARVVKVAFWPPPFTPFTVSTIYSTKAHTYSLHVVRGGSEQRLLEWANARFDVADAFDVAPTATAVYDYFGPSPYVNSDWVGLANKGRLIITADKGSLWTYDPIHGIAASSQGGDLRGDLLLYSPPPPLEIPIGDLSSVVSAHGLRLGISSESAARKLNVSQSAVKRISGRKSVLYARASWACRGPVTCTHDAIVIFRDDKAIAIGLYDVGP